VEEHRRGSLVWAAILIVLGAVLLLNNLGWTTITVWDLLRLWPLLLIAAGLDLLIGRRSAWGSVVVLVVLLLLLGGGLWLLPSAERMSRPPEEDIALPLQGATRGSVEIGFGVGELRVDSSAAPDRIVEGTVALHRGERLESSVGVQDGTLTASVRSQGQWVTPLFAWGGQPEWKLGLSREIPLRVVVDGGVGDVSVDLRRTMLSELGLEMGVGRMTVTLPSDGGFEGRLDNGVGLLLVRVPSGLGVRIRPNTGLGTVSMPPGYERDGDAYLSPGYRGAADQVELWLETGIGMIQVETYEGQ